MPLPFPGVPYVYRICPTCTRKRRCQAQRIPDDKRRWFCSQGHRWDEKLATLERVAELQKEIILKNIHEHFAAAGPLLDYLRRR